jgi:hypothetical protein
MLFWKVITKCTLRKGHSPFDQRPVPLWSKVSPPLSKGHYPFDQMPVPLWSKASLPLIKGQSPFDQRPVSLWPKASPPFKGQSPFDQRQSPFDHRLVPLWSKASPTLIPPFLLCYVSKLLEYRCLPWCFIILPLTSTILGFLHYFSIKSFIFFVQLACNIRASAYYRNTDDNYFDIVITFIYLSPTYILVKGYYNLTAVSNKNVLFWQIITLSYFIFYFIIFFSKTSKTRELNYCCKVYCRRCYSLHVDFYVNILY